MKEFRFVSIALATFLFFTITSRAQTNEGRILGTVRDSSGGVVVGAKITVTNTGKQVSRELVTNETGEYVAPSLEPGLYTVSAEAAGFKKTVSSVVRVEVTNDLRIDLRLEPGTVSETIVVNEQAAKLIDATTPTLGGSFGNKEINELPLQGRDWQNLVLLLPGVDRTPGGGFHSIISNGARPEDNNYMVDGTDDNDLYYGTSVANEEGVSGTPASLLPIDAIQEFSTQEHPTAEYGWKPGAVIQIGLKSGSNEFHGTAYYFARNSAVDARNWFNPVGTPLAPLILHQFGGSAGGPIIKDKLFIFGAYEGVRAIVGNPLLASSPNTGTLGGDLNNSILDVKANCQALPGCMINPLSLTLSGLYPVNAGSAPGVIFEDLANRNRADNMIVKVDYHFSRNNTFTGRYFFADSTQTEEDGSYLLPQFLSQAASRPQIIGGNWTYTPNSRVVSEARFGYNRISQRIFSADHAVNPLTYPMTTGINTGVTNPMNFGLPEIDVGNFFQLGGGNGYPLFTTPTQTYQFTEGIAYLKGRHNLHFGGEIRHGAVDNTRNRHAKGEIFFQTLQDFLEAGSVDPGNGTLLNPGCSQTPCGPFSGEVLVGNTRRIITQNAFAAYVADEFRFNSKLTITAGLRYDVSGVIHEQHDLLGNFEPAIGFAQVGKEISTPYHVQHDNFAPRIGLAWDPWGTGKTVIRAGAGIIYETAPISDFIGQTAGGGIGLNTIPTGAVGVTPGDGSIFAAVIFPAGNQLNWTSSSAQVFPFLGQPTSCDMNDPCSITSVKNNLDTPYTIFWNLNVQRAIGDWSSLQVGYVGQRGVKLFSLLDINQPNGPAAAACYEATSDYSGCEQMNRPFFSKFNFLGETTEFGNAQNSSYDGLQVTYKTRSWKGLNVVAGYTYAHSIDESTSNRHFNVQNSLDVRAERGNSDFDLRHRFTFAATYAIPGRKSFAQLLEGWQVNTIVILESGMPFSLYDSVDDFSFTGEFNDRWNITGSPNNIHWSKTTPIPFFPATDLRCIAAAGPDSAEQAQLTSFGGCYISGSTVLTPPANGTFGNMGRNIFRGPDFTNWDFSVSKNTKLGEHVTLQLRGEFFNVLNHPNFTDISGRLTGSIPGVAQFTPDVQSSNPVIGSGGSRHIQLGAKFIW